MDESSDKKKTQEKSKRPVKSKKLTGGGLLKFIIFCLIISFGVVAVMSFVHPQDLTDIEGYESPEELAEWKIRNPPRDLPAALRQAVSTETPVTITEEELNKWFQKNLALKQGGVLKDVLRAENFWVRLHPGRIEFIIERTLVNPQATPEQIAAKQDTYPHNLSMFYDVKKTTNGIQFENGGGRFGNITYTGFFKGYLVLVMPGFDHLSEHFAAELNLIRENLTHITVREGEITLQKLGSQTIQL